MAIKRLLELGIGTLLITVIASCVPIQESGLPAQQLSVPAGFYGAVLRFPNGEIFIQTGRLSPAKPDALHYYWLSEERFVEIAITDDLRCRLTEYTIPTALPDGRLGLSEICRSYWPDRPIGRDDARFIMAYDWETGAIEQIVEEPLSVESSSFSWNPEMTRGVQGIGSLLGTITWISPTDIEPMTVTIGMGEQSWSLDENLVVMEDYRRGHDRTAEVGIARNPAWSPDGRFIAFWASTNVIGSSGMSRARGTYSLYLLDPVTLQLQQILENVQNMTILVWSPDSQWLVFTGDIESSKDGLWLISADGNILEFIDRGSDVDFSRDFNGWNWFNNQEIIATRCLAPNCDQTEVVKYDVSAFVGAVSE
jgi:hypothetical protein